MWLVYILYSRKLNKTYTGSTNNFKERISKHNNGLVRSTKLGKPWIPVYVEFYPNETSARDREKHFKTSPGRRYLKNNIDSIIKFWLGSSDG
ncbi:MAG: GIY-YIG nuclease family protein [Candidatus Falkowbacteria bacterium]